MLRSILQDAAIAAAKGQSHPNVEPRHVVFAAARHFRSRPEIEPLVAIARKALDPSGTALGVPAPTPEATALLDKFATEADAVAGVLDALKGGGATTRNRPTPVAVAPVTEESAKPAVATVSEPAGRETTATVLAELDALIGLGSVKAQLRRIIAVVQANEERSKAGLHPVSSGLHLVFTGPPGTGKTTVARLVARLYASTGALTGSRFTEASRSDLVAGYVGQTAMKTAAVIDKTRPGVLFIDEAYALTPHHDSDFGAEAIAAMVKAMEDYRRELAVIVAGYGDEMADFVASNPGLKSRFKTYIAFPDYTPDELLQIFESLVRGASIALGAGVREKAAGIFARAVGAADFGNARFARSLFEEAYARMSARAAADGAVELSELTELTAEDLEWQGGGIQRKEKRIGFGEK
jgi:SpoVK/Ycf46/Vps4 family AAA+-type ATPase